MCLHRHFNNPPYGFDIPYILTENEETYEGILWPATEPGQNVTDYDACGPTADGYVMRVCNEDSTWSNDLIRDCGCFDCSF